MKQRIRFKQFCPPYVRGDEVTVDSVQAEAFVDAGAADFVSVLAKKPADPVVEKPPEKEVPAVPKKRGRPRKNPVPSTDGD